MDIKALLAKAEMATDQGRIDQAASYLRLAEVAVACGKA